MPSPARWIGSSSLTLGESVLHDAVARCAGPEGVCADRWPATVRRSVRRAWDCREPGIRQGLARGRTTARHERFMRLAKREWACQVPCVATRLWRAGNMTQTDAQRGRRCCADRTTSGSGKKLLDASRPAALHFTAARDCRSHASHSGISVAGWSRCDACQICSHFVAVYSSIVSG